jgi:hypothetical protein
MIEATAITPGITIGNWHILSVDPNGKRCAVSCACGGVHIYSVESVLDGSAVCHAAPLSAAQREALRDETEANERKRRLELHRWRPRAE